MGYTNYFTAKKTDDGKFPKEFVDAVSNIVSNAPCKLTGWDCDKLESKPEVSDERISLNGYGDDGHESFTLVPDGEWEFCKTAEKPYDIVVKAILITAERMGILSEEFSFDGERETDKMYNDAIDFLGYLKWKAKDKVAEECLKVTNVRVYPFKEGPSLGHMKALATVVLNDQFLVRGIRIMDGENGLFVNYPNDPFYKSENFRTICSPITRQLREHIENVVLEKYQKEVANG